VKTHIFKALAQLGKLKGQININLLRATKVYFISIEISL